jgi:glucokinase
MSGGRWLGFDIGGTRLKSAIVDETGSLDQLAVLDTEHEHFSRTWQRMLDLGRAAVDASPAAVLGVGVALPGLVETTFGSRHLPGKVLGIEDFPLRERLEAEFAVPVRCVNDGAAATLAEWRFGAARGHDDVVGLTLGTGVGCGVVNSGQLFISRHLGGGVSFGHATIQTGGRTCLCGNLGCAETLVSADAVTARLRDYLERNVPSVLREAYLADPRAITFQSLIEGVRQEDRICLEVLADFRRDLAALVVTAIHAFDPEVVVLAGGPLAAAGHFLPQVQDYVDRYAFIYPKDRRVPVLRARLEHHAGVLGAVALVMSHVSREAEALPE